MRNAYALLPTVLVFLTGAAFGQDLFQQAYGPLVTTGAFKTSHAVRHTDGTWTMRGSVADPTTLLHLNANGTTAWINDYDSPQISMVGNISSTAAGADNSTLAVFADTLEAMGPGLSRRHLGVARIAANGAVIWAKGHYYDVPGTILVPSDDHEVAVDGDGGFFLDGGEPSAPSVMRFTSNGTLSWARTLNDPEGLGRFMGLVSDGTGGCYFLAGYTTEFGQTSKVVIGRLNGSGTLVWNKTIEPAATGRILEPLALVELADGNLLITAREYGGGSLGTSGVLLTVSNTGDLLAANEYWNDASGTLYIYNTLERSDGQLWMDFQASGYGFARLDAAGAVQQAERFTYQFLGNSTGVVGWEETLMHNDEIGVIGAYFIDHNWTSDDPRTEFVLNLDAFDLDLCGTDPVTITRNVMSANAFIISSTTTASVFPVTEEAMTLNTTPLTAPATIPFCSLFVGVDDGSEAPQLMVHPTVVKAGVPLSVRTSEVLDVQVVDGLGRMVLQRTSIMPGSTRTIGTEGWARGMYLVQAYGRNAMQGHTVKVMVE